MRKFIFIGLLLITSLSIQAQYGHINLGNLISELPEAKAANSELEAYQQQLVEKGQAMATVFQKDYEAFAAAVQSGILTPVKQQEQQAVLEQKQQEIMGYERQMQADVAKKRDELLEPIVTRAQEVIAIVAKEKGLLLVFDTSVYGAIMYAADTENIMESVKAKMTTSNEE